MNLDLNLLKARLTGKTFISDIIYVPEINSTNEHARHFKEEDNILVLTDNQVIGKGRYGRIWESEPGKNLTFSIKKKFDIKPVDIQNVNFFFTNYTLSGIKNFLAAENVNPDQKSLELKWPNDVLLNKKKLCGFLIESDISEGNFIIGCGINVNQSEFNKDYHFKTTSLFNTFDREFDTTALLIKIIQELDSNIYLLKNQQFNTIFDNWMNNFNMVGKEIVYTDEKNFLGKAKIMDIQKDGGLQILINNEVKTIYSGDIRILYQS